MKTIEIEREIVPFLLKMARLPKGTPARAILERADGKTNLGSLLLKARAEYLKGSGRKGLDACIDGAFANFRSGKIDRFLDTLKIGISNNFDAAALVRRTAADLQEMEALEEKRRAAMALQKYTLLSAGGFFVPFILGATSSIIGIFSGIGGGLGLDLPKDPGVLTGCLFAYSLILPAICAVFIPLGIEGKKEAIPKYLALVPIGLAAFLLAKSMLKY
jgi:hypothetical protein